MTQFTSPKNIKLLAWWTQTKKKKTSRSSDLREPNNFALCVYILSGYYLPIILTTRTCLFLCIFNIYVRPSFFNKFAAYDIHPIYPSLPPIRGCCFYSFHVCSSPVRPAWLHISSYKFGYLTLNCLSSLKNDWTIFN